jgi:hypothetical protein
MGVALYSRLRFLLPLAVLAAAPLVGVGGRAQAGYMAPASLVDRPHADSFAGGATQAGADEMGAGADGFRLDADPQRDDGPARLESPALPPPGYAAFGHGANGAGSQPAPDGPGGGGSGHVPAATSRPAAEAPAPAGVLFLESSAHRPPPFPSRLFRPPRLS